MRALREASDILDRKAAASDKRRAFLKTFKALINALDTLRVAWYYDWSAQKDSTEVLQGTKPDTYGLLDEAGQKLEAVLSERYNKKLWKIYEQVLQDNQALEAANKDTYYEETDE